MSPGSVPDGSQLWLVRHGETEWSASHRHTGRWSDLPLTERGERQAAELPALLGAVTPTYVCSSPLQRSLRTAQIAGIAVDAVDPDAAEWDYGTYDGLTSAQIRERDPGWTIWTGNVPGGESQADVQARADRLLRRIGPHLAAGPVMIFGHGHMNRALAARWLGMPISAGGRFALSTAAPCLLGTDHGTPAVIHWNIVNPVGNAPTDLSTGDLP